MFAFTVNVEKIHFRHLPGGGGGRRGEYSGELRPGPRSIS